MSYKSVCSEIETRIKEISKEIAQFGPVYLFGVNQYSGFIINTLYQNGIEVAAIVDNNPLKHGSRINYKSVKAVNDVSWKRDIVLIASQHVNAMRQQLNAISDQIQVYSLFDFVTYNEYDQHSKKYWEDDVFEKNLMRLCYGEEVYKEVFNNRLLVVSPTVSIGDQFLWNIYFDKYLEENQLHDYDIVVASKAAARVINLFQRPAITIIEPEQMEQLVSYVMYAGEKNTNSLLVYPRYEFLRRQDIYADWCGIAWQRIYADYTFKLRQVKCTFPDWNQSESLESELAELGFVKGRTVILSPYANTVGELPIFFWEDLSSKLQEKGYKIITNVAGQQSEIKGTTPICIPFDKCVRYLEYAGVFISIRNGLCDIVGTAKCKKIVIFNDNRQLYTPEKHYNDLRVDNISPDCIYVTNRVGHEEKLISRILDCI